MRYNVHVRVFFWWLTGYKNKQKDTERYISQAEEKMANFTKY
jgi:hypothetical protein